MHRRSRPDSPTTPARPSDLRAGTGAWRRLAAAVLLAGATGFTWAESGEQAAAMDPVADRVTNGTPARPQGAPAGEAPAPSTALTEEVIPATDDVPTKGAADRAKLMEISCRDAKNRPVSWLDRTHSYLNQRLCDPAAWFDGFFGDDRALEETPVGTFFRLRSEARWDEEEGYRIRLRLSANISLPGASDRLRLLLTRDEDVHGEFEPYVPVEESDKQTRIGLRYNVSEEVRSRFDVDASVKVTLDSLNPILRARYRQVEQFTENTFGRFTQIAFWELEEGLGTTSRADWEWFRDYDTQLRLSGQGTWSESSDGLDWRTSVTGFRQLDAKTAIRTELGAIGRTDPKFETEEYFLNFRYRRTFLRPWLFYELQPEHAWVIDDESGNRRGDWRFITSLEIQFENRPARQAREERNLKRWFDWLNRQGRDVTGRQKSADTRSAGETQGRMNM